MSIPKKTNCCRILDSLNISYVLLSYDWSEDALDAISVADKIHMPHEQVFKTLVLKGDYLAVFVIIVPGNAEVSLKKVAKATGNTACSLLPINELYPLTFDKISVSPGQRGMQILIHPKDLQNASQSTVSNLL